MDWEQKLFALDSLCWTSLRMRKPGNWYVDARGREVGGNGFLTGEYGNGNSPQAAVEDDFQKMTNLPPNRYIVIHGNTDRARKVTWNGFMWTEYFK